MFDKLYYRLLGANRLKQRGDKFFLENDFARALSEYRRARIALSANDYRVATIDALIRECSVRIGGDVSIAEIEPSPSAFDRPETPAIPGLKDLFELAIADKKDERMRSYRGLGEDFQSGYVALVQGDGETAVHYLELAARKNPASFVLQLELGRALSMTGDMATAREELAKAHQMSPKDRELLNLLAAVDIELGRFEEAVGILEPMAEGKDVGPDTFFLLGKALAGVGRKEQALERFRRSVKLDSHFHEAYFEAAKILIKDGEVTNSTKLLLRACAIAPDEVSYNLALVRLVLDKDLEEEIGLEACDRLMVTDEDNQWQYLAWVAELYVRRGWKKEARDPLRKALKLISPDRSEERRELERKLRELETDES
jgi:Flp pilus assembly protein TadD